MQTRWHCYQLVSSTRTWVCRQVTFRFHDLRDLLDMCIVVAMTIDLDWVPDTEDFPARLALIRHHMRWNAKEAAIACGVKPQSWREWELSGRRPQDYEGVCKQIADATRCDLVWLMTGRRATRPEPPPHPSSLPRRSGQLLRLTSPAPDLDEVVNDEALAYLRLAEDAPLELVAPLQNPRRSTGSGGPAGEMNGKPTVLPRVDSNHQPFGCRLAA
jgi:transcriptional regulator with XRE-family HTH domain